MKIFKNRLILALLSLVLAAAVLFLYTRSVEIGAAKVPVVRLTASVTHGEQITKEKLAVVEVGGYNLEPSTIQSESEILGKYALFDMAAGQSILKSQISDSLENVSDKLSTLDGTRYAYSITIKDFANGLSDKLLPSDIVSVFVSQKEQGGVITPPELTYLEVLAATTAKGADKQGDTDKPEEENLKTVTVLASPEQIKALTDYEDNAEIHLALVYRGSWDNAQKYLEKQNEVLNHG